jgi:exosortase A
MSSQHRIATLLVLGLFISAALLFRETLAAMITNWSDSDTHAHGWLVFPAFAWLVWRQRSSLLRVPIQPSGWGLLALGAAVALWFAGSLAYAMVVQQFAFIGVVAALIWTICGTLVVRQLVFPLLLLIFAVPFGEAFVPALMEWTATSTVALLNLSGIPVYREGMFFSTSVGDFEVARACSGVRYLTASAGIGVLYGCLYLKRTEWRLAFLAVSIVVPILANALRAYFIVVLAHVSNMALATGIDHFIYGWVFFAVVVFAMLAVGEVMHRRESRGSVPAPPPVARSSTSTSAVRLAGHALASLALLIMGTVAAVQLEARASASPMLAHAGLPQAAPGWQGPDSPDSSWNPRFQEGARILRGSYRNEVGQESVTAALIYYPRERQGAELVGDGNVVADPERWRLMTADVHSEQGFVLRTERFSGVRSREELTVWWLYGVEGRAVVSPYAVKLYSALGRLRGSPASAAVIAFVFHGPSESAPSVLRGFVSRHLGAFLECTRSTSQAGQHCVAPPPLPAGTPWAGT